jgi:soluble lytic murein transglycosylase-like protein
MKKLLLMIPLLLFLQPHEAKACETPVVGIGVMTEAINATDLYIAYYSAINSIDADLVQVLIGGESGGNPKALNLNDNGSHDRGLMQINSCNFDWLREELGITDFYDPRQNIQCGCYILGLLNKKYDNIHRVLMSYNMGESRTRELWQQGIYSSRYSREIVNRFINGFYQ